MDDKTLKRLDLLGKGLFLAAIAVVVLSVIGAVVIATSSTRVLLVGRLQQQNRDYVAAAALIAGFISSGLLLGLGALVRLQVAGIRERE
jgi:hypothetical protein